MVLLVVGALVAGILTTLAPCVLPLLPVIVGGSVAPTRPLSTPVPAAVRVPTNAGVEPPAAEASITDVAVRRELSDRQRAVVIATSLGISVAIFTLALRASTALLGLPPWLWAWVSGGILIVLGLVSVFPRLWERVAGALSLQGRSNAALGRSRTAGGLTGPILTGAALGPVFSSCSPFYAYLIATLLPASALQGLVLLTAYVIGLSGTLLALSLLGQRLIRRLRWATDPHGWFRRTIGVLFIAVGLLVLTGADKDIQTWLVEHNPLEQVTVFDQTFIPER